VDTLRQAPITQCLVKVTVAAGTTSTLSSTGTIQYGIAGKAYSRAALANTATPTTDANTGLAFVPVTPNTGCVFLIGVNAAGTLKVAQGGLQALDVNGNFVVSPQFGSMPDDFCPVAYEVIKAGSTAAAGGWIFGTSNQAAVTGITYSIQDLIGMPGRPQVA
jgi:hypothetical protein